MSCGSAQQAARGAVHTWRARGVVGVRLAASARRARRGARRAIGPLRAGLARYAWVRAESAT